MLQGFGKIELESMFKASFSQTEIAIKLGVHKSTISRELKRNSMSRSNIYRAELAQYKCDTRHKLKTKHIRFTDEMRVIILCIFIVIRVECFQIDHRSYVLLLLLLFFIEKDKKEKIVFSKHFDSQ